MGGLLVLAAVLAQAPPPSTEAAAATPAASSGLSGRWRFNAEQSDDVHKKMQEAADYYAAMRWTPWIDVVGES